MPIAFEFVIVVAILRVHDVSRRDIMGIAQTGKGKTLAFGIPMVERLDHVRGRGLVILPTRELALQVDESLRKIAPAFGLKSVVLIGGDPIGKQIQILKSTPRILIGTPGRLIDHLQQKTLRLHDVSILVLDEATASLDSQSEAEVQADIDRLEENRTVISVGHRLSTLANMDQIIVLEKGRIVEQGTFNELVRAKGLFANMAAKQGIFQA